ncbi:NAD(P)-dependent oxidoreductase [Amycolatopsis jejuensis]|uniref:NAD(P)-dependent oxidoreductase n=1 Tax=Amycolatopsis jejuensis TaxID=330084 RepID=UPI0005240565|nr:NAD(P)-dependent oxidoreductase [Amycolatopsis jejuensis]
MNPSERELGWLGTGRLGTVMAARLIDAGERVVVWNRTTAKTAPLLEKGARRAGKITDLASCPVVFVCVSADDDLRQVVAGDDGLLCAQRKPGLIVDCSTTSPGVSAEVRAAATVAGVGFLAAPVSGNPSAVAEGAACIVASGPEASFTRAKPILDELAKVAVYAGDGEQSRLVKLSLSLYLGVMVQALAEVTSLAEKNGTTRAAFLEFFNSTVLASDWVRNRTGDLLACDWTPTGTTETLRKDFDLGLGAARELDVPLPVSVATRERIGSAIAGGLRDLDLLSLYEQQANAAGVRPPPGS